MDNPVKKVIALHDLSGLGRCSLSIVIPVLSAIGVQACPLPTAVLSTQTGGFEGFTYRDLSDEIEGYFKHLYSSADTFHAFYSGFLGSPAQACLVEHMINQLSPDTLVLIDPVMADDGKLYSTFDSSMADGFRHLIKKADIITPNVTEAELILGKTPSAKQDNDYIETLIRELATLTKAKIVVTGISGSKSVNCAFSEDKGKTVKFTSNERVNAHYPGTGDLFASVLLGKMLTGSTFEKAVVESSHFVKEALELSEKYDYARREGVLIEKMLPHLLTE